MDFSGPTVSSHEIPWPTPRWARYGRSRGPWCAGRFAYGLECVRRLPEGSRRETDMNAYARWAMLVAKVTSAPHDPRTLVLWARHVGVSVATIRARCRVADIAVLPSRDLGRMLRVVALSNTGEPCWDPAATAGKLRPEDPAPAIGARRARRLAHSRHAAIGGGVPAASTFRPGPGSRQRSTCAGGQVGPWVPLRADFGEARHTDNGAVHEGPNKSGGYQP